MKELDLLKKDWKKNQNTFNQLSKIEIYKMIHEKSSSIVKSIFIISIIEVLFWIILGLVFNSDEYIKQMNHPEIFVYLKIFDVFNYSMILIFIYLFYKNYITISTIASAKTLMRSILKTREIVNYYVGYNLIMLVVSAIAGIYIAFIYNTESSNLTEKVMLDSKFAVITFGILFFVILSLLAILWGIYRVIYGNLLRRLNTNYKELKKIEF